jgi:hypothetical protein
MEKVLQEVRTRLVYVLALSSQVKSDALTKAKEKKVRIMDESAKDRRTQSIIKNGVKWRHNLAVNQLKVGQMNEIPTGALVYGLLVFLVKKPAWKADRKMKGALIWVYETELRTRWINPDKSNLECYMASLSDQERRTLFG